MKTLELRLKVTPQGEVILPVIPELLPGEYNAVLVIEAAERPERMPLHLPVFDLGPWSDTLSLRREDLYGDDN